MDAKKGKFILERPENKLNLIDFNLFKSRGENLDICEHRARSINALTWKPICSIDVQSLNVRKKKMSEW